MKKTLSYVIGVFFLLSTLAFAADPAPYANAGPWIETDKDVYNYGEQISVHFYNAPGYAGDWICIVPAGSGNTEAGDYKYIPEGLHEGIMIFKPPLPGEYEVRAYYYYSPLRYNVSARFQFTVAGEGYGYDYGYENEYVDVPIIYGEPCYYTPPIAVTFAFDYFTYEIIGGYVDIVFWRGGHRYHHKPWYDHGMRISPDFINSRDMHHRIPGKEFFSHRERLERDHHITHPDSFYGLKERPKKPAQQWEGQNNQRPQGGQQQPQQTQPSPRWKSKDQRPQWGQQSQQTQQPPQLEQKDRRTQWGQQPSQQKEQRSKWGQKPPQQVRQRPQNLEQRQQWKQRQPQQIRQRPQVEKKESRQMEKQKPSQEKHREGPER